MKTLRFICLAVLFPSILASQTTKSARAAKATPVPAKESTAATITVKRPSEEMLDSFMHHMFGYDPMIKWKVDSVRPSEVPGITEVVVSF